MPLYIGQLKSLPSLPDDADCPLVTAEPLAELLPVERVVEGGEPVVLQNIRPPPFKPMRARRNSEIRSYYVCTQTDCGWSGGSRQKHALNRSSCKATPCLLRYTRGQSLKSLVADFLARCTPRPRREALRPPHLLCHHARLVSHCIVHHALHLHTARIDAVAHDEPAALPLARPLAPRAPSSRSLRHAL